MGFNKEKFSEVLHYIIHKCGHMHNVGKTVIWKILYFSDFDYYELYEKYLTGENYSKLPKGPAPRHFDEIIKQLICDGMIQMQVTKYAGYSQNKFICIETPKLSKLNATEITEINKVIQKLSNMNATQVSALSHDDMPWKSAKNNETIDYEMVFYRSPITSVREYEECQK